MNALELAWQAVDAAEADPIHAAKVKGLMVGYDARWNNAGWECLGAEQEFHIPLVNPETCKRSRTFTFAGKKDVRLRRDGKLWLGELKTTSDDITDPNGSYWRRLDIDSQVSSYTLAEMYDGEKPEGTLFDVIRKPGIRPKKLAKAIIKELMETREYFGFPTTEATYIGVEAGEITEENAELYMLRLARATLNEPERYFGRKCIHRLDSELIEYAQELWDVGQEMLGARRLNRHYRNSGACMNYGRPCQFLGICSGHDEPQSDNWRVRENVHHELEGAETGQGGRDVLTHSRVRCFQTCRAKHYYQYEIGLERAVEDEADALLFGSLMHLAVEAWWNYYREDHNESNGNESSAATEVAEPIAADGTTAETGAAVSR